MISRSDQNKKTNRPHQTLNFRNISLKLVLIVPFVALITGAVGLVGYLSYRSGQEAVNKLALTLRQETTTQITQYLDNYLATPVLINRINADLVKSGKLNIQDLSQIEKYFISQFDQFDNVNSNIFFGNEQGSARIITRGILLVVDGDRPNQYARYNIDRDGNKLGLVSAGNFSGGVQERPWYKAAVQAGKPTRVPIYSFADQSGLSFNSSQPIYDPVTGKLLGVFSAASDLKFFQEFLASLKISSRGQVFIMERDGLLVGDSTGDLSYKKKEKDGKKYLERTKAIDSENQLIRSTSRYLLSKFGGFSQIKNSQQIDFWEKGDRQFVQVFPYQDNLGLDWLIVVVVPESDFMGEIQTNIRWTFLLCGITFVAAIGMGLSAASWVIKPIKKLSRSSQLIAQRDWQSSTPIDLITEYQAIKNHPILEIETLADSFHQMLVQLQDSHHKIAENLQQAELDNQNILSLIPDLMFINSAEGFSLKQLQTNYQESVTPLITNSSGEFLGDFLPTDILQLRLYYIHQALQTGKIQTYEQQIEVEGKLQDEEVRIIKISDREVLVMIRNISDRKLIEMALQNSEETFRHAFEDASIGVAIVSRDGHWLKVNSALCQIIGYSPEELFRLTFQDITHPDDLEADLGYVHQLLTGKISTYQMEKRYIHKQGSIVWVLLNVSLVRNAQGNPLHFISQVQDITTRKEAQKTLELQSVIINNMAGSICLVKTSDRTIVYTNPKFDSMFGYIEGELIGQSVRVLNYLDNQMIPDKSYLDIVMQIEQNGEAKYEVQNRKKDGTPFWCRVHSSKFEQPEYGTVYINIQDDITELKLAERELTKAKEAAEAANHTKSRFIANMSHELRTPLNAILGFSQLMKHTPNLPVDHYENAEIIHRSGNYLLSLINSILDLSKIEADKTTLNIQDFRINSLLDELRKMLQLRVNNAGLSLVFECSPEVPAAICTDEMKLKQVLLNLLSNAIKFTQQGEITLRVNCSSPANSKSNANLMLYFIVQDTGVGITPEELPQIFEAFNQAEAGRETQEGTGLGLTISRRFVQLMGGEIVATSELGKGTTFQFQIPVREGQDLAQPQIEILQKIVALAPGQEEYRILIVDDIEVNRQLLVKILSPLGFQVQEAKNGQEAIALWESWQPQLIWMDLRMPVMDGYTATKQIKARPQGSKTIIIALTADVRQDNRAMVLAAGCADLYTKPFKAETIFAALSQHLGVSYIYAEEPIVSLEPERVLTTGDFASMPPEWRQRVYNACLVGNFDLVIELTTEIPATASFFAKSLAEMADQFQSEAIVKLIQPLI